MRFKELSNLIDKRNVLPVHKSKKFPTRLINRITKIAVHHSLTKTGSAKAFANYHVNNKKWPGIGYHFVIEKNGDIIWCNDLDDRTYHVGKSNGIAVGICLVGDFRVQDPTKEQTESLYTLLDTLLDDLNLTHNDIKGHSEFPGYDWKSCPVIDMTELRNNIKDKDYRELTSVEVTPIKINEYIVQRSDTFWDIVSEFDSVTARDIMILNPHINPNRLKAGQKIKLPN